MAETVITERKNVQHKSLQISLSSSASDVMIVGVATTDVPQCTRYDSAPARPELTECSLFVWSSCGCMIAGVSWHHNVLRQNKHTVL